MRIRLGPLSLRGKSAVRFSAEHRAGKPYFINRYQLEPRAWVWRTGAGSVSPRNICSPIFRVPSQGAVTATVCTWALRKIRSPILLGARPTSVKVVDPLGRRYLLPLARGRLRLGLVLLAALALVALPPPWSASSWPPPWRCWRPALWACAFAGQFCSRLPAAAVAGVAENRTADFPRSEEI